MNKPLPKQDLKELTLRGIIIGALITVVFTASNVYLGLKVGLTFSSAIPSAVISMAILRYFSQSNILENNMVQTQASAAGTLSAVIFIMPGLLMIGYWNNLPIWETMLICASGGALGVIFTIPLRHAMVVNSDLPYPEGVAAAEILKLGCGEFNENNENNSATATQQQNASMTKRGLRDILFGGGIAALWNFLNSGLNILPASASYWVVKGRYITQLPLGFSLALVSAGYLVGISAGIAILIGLFIAWGVAVPLLGYLHWQDIPAGITHIAFAETLWAKHVRFIGAGILAIAAIWTLITLIKPVIEGMKISMRAIRTVGGTSKAVERTDQDLSPKTMLLLSGLMLLILFGTFYSFVSDSGLSQPIAWLLVSVSVLFVFIIGFLVAAACGYMAGLVGSSASPISGISIISVTIVSLLLLGVGHLVGVFNNPASNQFGIALAIFVTSAVTAVASISNDNLQDLKTGYLVKATPWRQQVALLIGCVVGAAVIAPVIELLYYAYGFTGAMPRAGMDLSQVLAAPQATIMATIAKGVFNHQLQWEMLVIGALIGVGMIIVDQCLKHYHSTYRLPVLAIGIGVYLPPSSATPLILGAVLSWIVTKRVKKLAKQRNLAEKPLQEVAERKGTLIASGFIVGESLMGIVLALIILFKVTRGEQASLFDPSHLLTTLFGSYSAMATQCIALALFIILCIAFVRKIVNEAKRVK